MSNSSTKDESSSSDHSIEFASKRISTQRMSNTLDEENQWKSNLPWARGNTDSFKVFFVIYYQKLGQIHLHNIHFKHRLKTITDIPKHGKLIYQLHSHGNPLQANLLFWDIRKETLYEWKIYGSGMKSQWIKKMSSMDTEESIQKQTKIHSQNNQQQTDKNNNAKNDKDNQSNKNNKNQKSNTDKDKSNQQSQIHERKEVHLEHIEEWLVNEEWYYHSEEIMGYFLNTFEKYKKYIAKQHTMINNDKSKVLKKKKKSKKKKNKKLKKKKKKLKKKRRKR